MAGGTSTRSAAIDSGIIKTLCDLDDAHITTLKDTYSVQVVQDLVFLDKNT